MARLSWASATFLTVSGLFFVSACAADNEADATTAPVGVPIAVDELVGSWVVTEIDGEFIEVEVNTAEIPRLIFDATTVNGNMGCNGFGARYEAMNSTITVSDLVSEMEGCSIPDGSNQGILTEGVLGRLFTADSGFTVATLSNDTMVWEGLDHIVSLAREP